MHESRKDAEKLEEQPLKRHEETWHEEKLYEKESDVGKHQAFLDASKEL